MVNELPVSIARMEAGNEIVSSILAMRVPVSCPADDPVTVVTFAN